MAITIKQGDAFDLPVRVTVNGAAVTSADVEAVEFMVGDVRKTYPEDATYDIENGMFYVSLAQQDTFSFPADDQIMLDVRVKFKGGKVLGIPKMTPILVYDATSEVVI